MGCLSENTIQQIVQDDIAPDERTAAELHFNACADCLRALAEAAKHVFQDDSQDATVVRHSIPHLQPDARVGRYIIVRMLGEGGMGVVYVARDPQLDRDVALKLVRSASDPSEYAKARTLREAKAMARLNHPNVVAVYDAGEHDGRVFIAMELIASGRTLDTWLGEQPRSWREIVDMYMAAGRGLAAAHAAGLVHRDFKPQNVLIGSDGRPRVGDFGLARDPFGQSEIDPQQRATLPTHATLTQTGAVLGTPAYMAREQFLGGETDARTDQFSFCVAFYEALYKERPYGGASYAEIAERVVESRMQPRPKPNGVPEALYLVLGRGLAGAPDARYPTLETLLAAVDHAVAPRRRRGPRIALALAAVTAIAASVFAIARSTAAGPEDAVVEKVPSPTVVPAPTVAPSPAVPLPASPTIPPTSPTISSTTPPGSPPSPATASAPVSTAPHLSVPAKKRHSHRVQSKAADKGSGSLVKDAPLDPWEDKL
jgi:serine/threonine protein kinase